MKHLFRAVVVAAVCGVVVPLLPAQPPPGGGPGQPPGGFGGPGGPGGPGGMMGGPRKIVAQFDADKDGKLNADERKAAREFLKKDGGGRKGMFGGKGPPGGFGGKGKADPPKPGPKVAPADVKAYPAAGLYDPAVLRTLFLDIPGTDWEAEMADFYHTDVELPATLNVDGKSYPNVGVHFRGMSSFFTVGAVPNMLASVGGDVLYVDSEEFDHRGLGKRRTLIVDRKEGSNASLRVATGSEPADDALDICDTGS